MSRSEDLISGRRSVQYAAVIGSGRLGSAIAGALSATGTSVVVIDPREERLHRLPPDFSGFTITGDGSEISVLRAAKVEQADCLCATTDDDNLNLLVAQIAKHVFRVPIVIARLFDPARESVYRQFDIMTVSPTELAADAFLGLIP